MDKAFYFMLKALFVPEIFRFLYWNFGYVEKRFDKKVVVNFKIYDVTHTDKQMITIHILPNISRSKGNQTIKFGQLIEYNMINIFLEKSYAKWPILRSSYKKSKLIISPVQQFEML